MATAFIPVNEASQKLLVAYLEICYNRMNISTARTRYERIDKAIQMEMTDRRAKIPHYYDDITMPVIKQPVRKIGNFLIDIYTSTPHLFEAVSGDPEKAETAKQMNVIIEENSKTSKWGREMVQFLKDLPKYNVGGIACEWVESELVTIGNSKDVTKSESDVVRSTRAGNVLKRLDVYNTFYDTAVPVNVVADVGDFIGWNEQYSSNRLHKLLETIKVSLGITKVLNESSIFSGAVIGSSRYYRPQVNQVDSVVEEMSPMEQLFNGHAGNVAFTTGTKSDNRANQQQMTPYGTHELQTLFIRVVPKVFGIKAPVDNKVQIFKVLFLNWATVLTVELLSNAHGIFPAMLCQIDEEGIDDQVKSAAELLMPMQNLQTKLYDARLQGLKRGLSDRALYNTSRIDKKHLDEDNPSAKIPVKPNLLNPELSNAYMAIPFQDSMGGTLLQELGFLHQTAQRISGLNDPQQGNFQKGNKTLGEFNEIMQNADDDLRTWAKLVEVIAITPLKYIIKTNMLQYQAATTINSTQEGKAVTIDPMELRKAALDFKLADGLVNKDALMDLPTARSLFELLLQSPQLMAFYGEKLPQLVEYIFTSVGFDTSKFRGTNPQALMQQPQAGAPTDGAV